jgi:hypothetical protein
MKPQICSMCGGTTEVGSVEVKGTFLGFVVAGLSYQHLWFRGGDKTRTVLVESGHSAPAHRCVRCDVVTILGTSPAKRAFPSDEAPKA